MRIRLGNLTALCPLLAAGCGRSSDPGPSAPKSIAIAQVREMPLEEAGDMNIRQNLAEQPKRAILGRDTPGTTASR